MVIEIKYTTIQRVLDNILDHPLLRDVSVEQAVRYALRFIAMNGFNNLYQDKQAEVEIHAFRGMLPCDLIQIIQVKDRDSHICLRSMEKTFNPGLEDPAILHKEHKDLLNNVKPTIKGAGYIPPAPLYNEELTFKTQGRIIYTSFPEGAVCIAYKAIPVDDDGFPMIIDNEVYLNALELFIKKIVFTYKFDMGKINAVVLQNTQQEYAIALKLLHSEFTTPSISEAQTLANILNTAIVSPTAFDRGFRGMGNREYIKRH